MTSSSLTRDPSQRSHYKSSLRRQDLSSCSSCNKKLRTISSLLRKHVLSSHRLSTRWRPCTGSASRVLIDDRSLTVLRVARVMRTYDLDWRVSYLTTSKNALHGYVRIHSNVVVKTLFDSKLHATCQLQKYDSVIDFTDVICDMWLDQYLLLSWQTKLDNSDVYIILSLPTIVQKRDHEDISSQLHKRFRAHTLEEHLSRESYQITINVIVDSGISHSLRFDTNVMSIIIFLEFVKCRFDQPRVHRRLNWHVRCRVLCRKWQR